MTKNTSIIIKGARVNNLKNIDVEIPRNRLVVITGLSGSGKSSLAFDTLYAEGQRRYVESLSSYARQFLGRMSKPECDFIKGIPPAIAIEQKVSSRNPRSTVGTSTEIYEYLRLLYARVGRTFSPVSGQEVKKHSTEDIVNCMLQQPEGTRYTVLAPILLREGRTLQQQLEIDMKQGFNRLEVNGEMVRIDEYQPKDGDTLFLLVDRMTASSEKDAVSRLTDSAETAMYEGDGACLLRFYQPDGSTSLYRFSTKFEADGITFEEPNDQMFSFNSPIGACPECEGFGRVVGIDEHLVIPNRSLSVYEGAVVCWRGEKMGEWKDMVIRGAEKAGFPIFHPLLPTDGRTAPDAVGRDPLLRGHQRLLQDGAGESIQDTISRNAGTLSRQNALPQMSWHKVETRSRLCPGRRTQHLRIGGPAHHRTKNLFR